ncbi:MAG TPA: hypothetical protein VHY30_01400 [Verrucomicrobiae bacterium]|nr:hypothetical protein [Verrucomicrobiae bacterium]
MKNQISCANNSATLEDRFVAFIDILGFRDLVQRMTSGELELFKTVKTALESILENEARNYDPYTRISHTRQMTAFSDCIVISDLADQFSGVLFAARDLYIRLLLGGILCRGAIARGLTYHSGRVVFGEGLIRAYELESQAAIYPRIIVTDEVQKRLAESDAASPLNIKFSPILARDHDGLWFIDPFAHPRTWTAYRPDENPEEVKSQAFNTVRKRIVDGYTRAQQKIPLNLGQIAKHRWLAQRFNTTLSAERRTEPTQIEV